MFLKFGRAILFQIIPQANILINLARPTPRLKSEHVLTSDKFESRLFVRIGPDSGLFAEFFTSTWIKVVRFKHAFDTNCSQTNFKVIRKSLSLLLVIVSKYRK